MRLQGNRSGFALPMAILIIGFITAGVLAGFARTGAEVQIANNQAAETAAFGIAEAGLATYMGIGDVSNTDRTFTFPGGQARVIATLVRAAVAPTDTAIWLVRSVGTANGGPGQPPATRTVAQLAFRVTSTMQVLSSWTSLSGIHKNGNAGSISGFDACTGTSVAGVAVPDGTFTGKENPVAGTPEIAEMGTVEQMAAQIKIDWPNIAKPVAPAIKPDYVVCLPGTASYDSNYTNCGSPPPSSVFTSNPDHWPVTLLNGSSPLPVNGRGILIVTGDLTLNGGDAWDGIILVGGRIIDNGNGNISGAVVTGLNVLKGETVEASSRANGTKAYQYDSCKVASAAAGMSKLSEMSNAWADNLSTW